MGLQIVRASTAIFWLTVTTSASFRAGIHATHLDPESYPSLLPTRLIILNPCQFDTKTFMNILLDKILATSKVEFS